MRVDNSTDRNMSFYQIFLLNFNHKLKFFFLFHLKIIWIISYIEFKNQILSYSKNSFQFFLYE
jgi:hypothetical protein